jgi:PTH2 family peptidyl-tRNA hydrolase
MKTKQVIVMRADLDMDAGKVAAQAGHAVQSFMTKRFTPGQLSQTIHISEPELAWIENSFTKICVWVYSEEELEEIAEKAEKAGIVTHLIVDNGATVFNGVKTKTCLALGPDYNDALDPIVSHLKTLKEKHKVREAKRLKSEKE